MSLGPSDIYTPNIVYPKNQTELVCIATGKVKFYNRNKRFGFIQQDQGEDVFVHESGVTGGPIADGDTVEFDVEQGQRGPKAINVRKV